MIEKIVKYNLMNFLMESEEPFTPLIVRLFKLLNEEKKKVKTRPELLKKIEQFSSYMGIPANQSLYLLELYSLNYRKDGDYSNLTKDNFVDPRHMKSKRVINTKTNLYAIAQLPFTGSNLKGYWTKNDKGEEIYEVNSYGWYPIYIYKDGIWFENSRRYSSSTSRQMSNVNPVEYSDELLEKVYVLTPDEMQMVKRGDSIDKIMRNKLMKAKEKEPEIKSKKITSIQPDNFGEANTPKVAIKFKIDSLDTDGDNLIVNVNVYDVVKKIDNKSVPTPENYLKGELQNITKEYVEQKIINRLKDKFKEYVGPRFFWHKPYSDIHKIKYRFNHLKK